MIPYYLVIIISLGFFALGWFARSVDELERKRKNIK